MLLQKSLIPKPLVPCSGPRLGLPASTALPRSLALRSRGLRSRGKHVTALNEEEVLSKVVSELQFPAKEESIPSSTGSQLAPGTLLEGKYTITKVLGTGGFATTYQATTSSGSPVAVKALSLRSSKDWKAMDLFQREAQTLAALNHPGIPRYIDYFEVDTPDDKAFYLVQEEAAGKSLAQMMSEGARCTTQEATRIASDLCEILQYLSDLHPPVVHRDVKPENIVLEGGAWGGRVYLIDFGGVAAVAKDSSAFASTVVGTYGYMAPEQFRGLSQPASDMYALGATLLFLLSGKPPFAFPQERMRINWRASRDDLNPGYTPPNARWGAVLDGLLEPVAEDRLTARQVLDLLQGKTPVAPVRKQAQSPMMAPLSPASARLMTAQQLALTRVTQQPAGSHVQLQRSPNRLDITIPPKGLFNAETLMTGSFAIAWNAFVAVWTVGALSGGGILFALFSLPFWFAGVQLGKQAFGSALIKERFAIGSNKFRLGQELALLSKDGQSADFLGGKNEKTSEGFSADLRGARVITTMFVNDMPQTCIEVLEGVRKYRFGEGLDIEEQQWLVHEINSHLEGLRGQPIDYDAFPPWTPLKLFGIRIGFRERCSVSNSM